MRTRKRVFALLISIIGLFLLTACDPPSEDWNIAHVNALRAAHGVPQLTRVHELNVKAWTQADLMAANGVISHSTDLAAGIPAGWRVVGENVASAGSIQAAQAALEASPSHMANLIRADYTEVGIGVTITNGVVYLVQIFVAR